MRATSFPAWSWICDAADALPGARAADQPVWDSVVLWVGDRMFGLLCEDARGRELLTLKLPPADGEALRHEHAFVEAGYHMDKRHWTSVVLAEAGAGTAAGRELVLGLVEDSHACLVWTLPRWRQREIATGVPRG